MLIAESLLLLATDDATGKTTVARTYLDLALGGAILTDLAVCGCVVVDGEGRKARVTVTQQQPGNDPTLAVAIRRLAEAGRSLTPNDAIRMLSKGLRDRLHDVLESRGILRREETRVLGVFPTTRWPSGGAPHRAAIRAELRDILLHRQQPSIHAAALITFLNPVDMLKTVVDRPDLKAAWDRAREIQDENWAADAVHRAIRASQSAVAAATLRGP